MKKDWVNILFLTLTPVIGIVGTAAYTWYAGFSLWMPLLTLGMYLAVGISICAGYHRFFSHKSYEAARPVQYFYAFFGAMAAQNSILWWSSSHRVHHKYVDKDWDPYNIQRGFWWAHILWIFYKNDQRDETFANSPDLLANPVVMWQHKWHKVILIVGGFGIPTLIGAAFGNPLAGLLWGGFLRLAVIHHTTFFVNSLAHQLASRCSTPRFRRATTGWWRCSRSARATTRSITASRPISATASAGISGIRPSGGSAPCGSRGWRGIFSPRRYRRSSRRGCARRCAWWSRRWPSRSRRWLMKRAAA